MSGLKMNLDIQADKKLGRPTKTLQTFERMTGKIVAIIQFQK